MKHAVSEELLAAYVDGRVPEPERRAVESHVDQCAQCREEVSSLREIVGLEALIAKQEHHVGPNFAVKVMEEVRGCAPHGEWRLTMAVKKIGGAFAKMSSVGREAIVFCMLLCFVSLMSVRYLGNNVSRQFSNVSMSIGGGGEGPRHEYKPGTESRFSRFSHDKNASDLLTSSQSLPAPAGRVRQDAESERLFLDLPREHALTGEIDGAADGGAFSRPTRYQDSHILIQPQLSSERYGSYVESARILVRQNPLSTFSLDVDTGSYTNIRRFLNSGTLPPPDSVRIEELLNYFDYNYSYRGEAPFSVSYEIAPSPFNEGRYLLQLGIKARTIEPSPETGWNLVFLIDTSGSMAEANKLPLVKSSMHALVNNMRNQDRIAIVTYADGARVALNSTSGAQKDLIRSVLDRLSANGSTNGGAGIDMAYQAAQSNMIHGGVNRVILATDGDFNVGNYSFQGLMDLVQRRRESGITLTVLGFGQGNLNEKMLEQLADRGNGNYFYLDSYNEARRVLSSALVSTIETAAKDVKAQIEFNPEHVLEYRLIGYDNRVLARQDFDNDRVDAGEIGSGHAVTVLYEIVLTRSKLADQIRGDYRYQKAAEETVIETEADRAGELGYLKLRYKEPMGRSSELLTFVIETQEIKDSYEQASRDFRFAAAVSAFGHLLRRSSYAGNYSFRDLVSLAQDAQGVDEDGKRREFVQLLENAASLNAERAVAR